MTVRVRYAPSPTGHLHIGGVRTALFNYLFARHHGGQFILRIEDTDLERNVAGAESEMLEGFRWLGFTWDEGPDVGGPFAPYRCTDRLPVYQQYLQQLAEGGLAYPCYCTADELQAEHDAAVQTGQTGGYSGRCRHLSSDERAAFEAEGRKPSWRFRVEPGRQISVDDLVRGLVSFDTDFGDFVIVKSNGIPTYQFQVVVDDALMNITHVIRGEEHLSNTPRQLVIYDALGFERPVFAHLPQVLNQDRKKLSKRDPNVKSVHAYRADGYLPEAIVNFLALLGWSPEGEEEIFDLDSLSMRFDLRRVNRSGAIFDTEKLEWMAGVYIRKTELGRLVALVREQLDQAGWALPDHADVSWLERMTALFQEKMSSASDFLDLAQDFFHEDIEWSEEGLQVLRDDAAQNVVRRYAELAQESSDWTADASKARCKQIQKELGVKGKSLFMPVRAAITGHVHGSDLQQSIACLPKEWVVSRIQSVLRLLEATDGS